MPRNGQTLTHERRDEDRRRGRGPRRCRSRVGLAAPASGADPDRAVLQGQVTRLYLADFRRQPDLAGLDVLDRPAAGGEVVGPGVQLLRRVDGEFRSTYGGRSTDAGFVNLVYLNVLARAPDAAGRDYWVAPAAIACRLTPRWRDAAASPTSKEFDRQRRGTDGLPAVVLRGRDRRPTSSDVAEPRQRLRLLLGQASAASRAS